MTYATASSPYEENSSSADLVTRSTAKNKEAEKVLVFLTSKHINFMAVHAFVSTKIDNSSLNDCSAKQVEVLNPNEDHVLQKVEVQVVHTRDTRKAFVANFTNIRYYNNHNLVPYKILQTKHSIS